QIKKSKTATRWEREWLFDFRTFEHMSERRGQSWCEETDAGVNQGVEPSSARKSAIYCLGSESLGCPSGDRPFIMTLLILLREMSGSDDSWCKIVVLISEPGCLGGLRGQSLVLWAANFGVESRCQIVDRGQAKLGQGNHGVNRVASASTHPRQRSVV
ncbi:hypothetical protein K2Y11_04085, partial [bacterium]|nr:hypothetical protein [bacterium]